MSAMSVLQRLEWSAASYGPPTGMGMNNGDRFASCPICRGIRPDQGAESQFCREAIGHRKNCELVVAIQKESKE